MNWTMVGRLIWKDWYLNRGMIIAAIAAGVATLAAIAMMPEPEARSSTRLPATRCG